jgi:hypothetical protein
MYKTELSTGGLHEQQIFFIFFDSVGMMANTRLPDSGQRMFADNCKWHFWEQKFSLIKTFASGIVLALCWFSENLTHASQLHNDCLAQYRPQ